MKYASDIRGPRRQVHDAAVQGTRNACAPCHGVANEIMKEPREKKKMAVVYTLAYPEGERIRAHVIRSDFEPTMQAVGGGDPDEDDEEA